MRTLTSSIYAMGPYVKRSSSPKKKKDTNHIHKMKQVNDLVASQKQLKETLDSLRVSGLLEVRVTDAVNPEWINVPLEWTSYDFSVEEYRVAGGDPIIL